MIFIKTMIELLLIKFADFLSIFSIKLKYKLINILKIYKLRKIAKHAYHNSVFYKKIFNENGINEKNISKITFESLPVIKKSDIINNYKDIICSKDINSNKIFESLIRSQTHELIDNKYNCVYTSGTSGVKLPVLYENRELKKIIFNNFINNAKPYKSLFSIKTRVVLLAVLETRTIASLVFRYAPVSVYNKKEISIKNPINEIINELNQFKPEMIIAYPGIFISLTKYKKEGLLKINPKKIYLTGEVLTEENLKLIKENFNSDIYNLYNCSECMNMAVRKNFGKFKLFNNLNHVEILDENNKPVSKGQIGKVVITNFVNLSQPLIRYELGDLAVSSANENEEFSFEGIIGRKYRPIIFKNNNGEPIEIFTLTFYEIIAKSIEVVKAQILIGNNYFKINLVCDDIYLLNCELNVIKYLKQINSDDSITFEIEKLDDILPESNGKIPLIKFLDNYEEIPNILYNVLVTENANIVLN